MSYSVKTLPEFDKNLKKLVKKYASMKKEFIDLVSEIRKNPKSGTQIGNNCYKIRMSIASKGKGKRGGARVITNILVNEKTVYLLSIYDKSEKDDLTKAELLGLLKSIKTLD